MRLTAIAALVFLVGAAQAGAAQAQTPLTGTTGPLASSPPRLSRTAPRTMAAPVTPGTEQVAPPATATATAAPAHHGHSLQERFDVANTTHDGHLTLEQARAHMPSVARDFAAIDTDHKGYVTEDQIREHRREVRAEHRAAKLAAAKTK